MEATNTAAGIHLCAQYRPYVSTIHPDPPTFTPGFEECQSFPVPWDAPILRGLAELSIGFIPPEHQPTLTQIRAFLLACPNVNILSLMLNPPWEADDPEDTDVQSIHLSHVSNFKIDMPAQSWATLLKHLVLPEEFTWRIEIPYCPFHLKDRLIPVGNLSATGQVLVVTVSPNYLEVYQERNPDPVGSTQKIKLAWPEEETYEFMSVIFQSIVELVKNTSWANTTNLRMHFAGVSVDEGRSTMWKELLEVFPGLTHLSISLRVLNIGNPEFGLAQALSTPQKLVDGTTSFLLPNLRVLHMRNAKFMRSAAQARAFGKCFQIRQKAAPLQELILINSTSLSRAVFQSLKESVTVVQERDEDPTDSEIELLRPIEKETVGFPGEGGDGSEDWETCSGEADSESESD